MSAPGSWARGGGRDRGHLSLPAIVARALEAPGAPGAVEVPAPTCRLLSTRCTTLQVGRGEATGGIFRWSGRARTGEGTRSWSVILKILRQDRRSAQLPAHHPWYWRRESDFYASELPARMPGGTLAVPRCLGLEDRGDEVWLWLEDLGRRTKRSWDLGHFREAALRAGLLNGAYLAGGALPDVPWLVRSWQQVNLRTLRKFLGAQLERPVWKAPASPRWLPMSRRLRLKKLWKRRGKLLELVASQPRTLCHRDLNAQNLFLREEGARLVALDWHTLGEGALAEDLGALVIGSVMTLEWPWQQLAELEAAVLEGYREGLATAQASYCAAEIRRSYAACASLRWSFNLVLPIADMLERLANPDDPNPQQARRALRKLSALHEHVISLGEEALGGVS